MSDRITRTHLQAQVDRLNRLTGAPATPYTKQPDGTYRLAASYVANVGNHQATPYTKQPDGTYRLAASYVANVGNHHLSQQYGGYCVHRDPMHDDDE